MKVKPLTGQVLIEVETPPTFTTGGVALPGEVSLSPEFVQEQHANPEKPAKNHIGIVRAVGAWPKTRKGLLRMPEYGVGARVVFNPFRGTPMQQEPGQRLRMVRQEDVMAVLI